MSKVRSSASIAVLVAAGVCLASLRSNAATNVDAGEKPGVKIGSDAPEWIELEGVDGKLHGLSELKDAKAVLVVFTCNHCPVAKAYEDRVIALYNDYHKQGVEVVAINVNNMEADKLPAMKERSKEKGFEFAYLYDPSQAIGRAYGATVTPHVFLLDGSRKVAYMGAIDDNMNADKAETQYVRTALDAVLAGKEVESAETKPAGCGIKYD